jgi:hypothetical protein
MKTSKVWDETASTTRSAKHPWVTRVYVRSPSSCEGGRRGGKRKETTRRTVLERDRALLVVNRVQSTDESDVRHRGQGDDVPTATSTDMHQHSASGKEERRDKG